VVSAGWSTGPETYVPLETIQLLSETSFSKIKNKVIWGGTLK